MKFVYLYMYGVFVCVCAHDIVHVRECSFVCVPVYTHNFKVILVMK